MSAIARWSSGQTLAIANGAAVTGEIDISAAAAGGVLIPGAWTAADLSFYVCMTSGGTFVRAVDDAGAIAKVTNIETAESRGYGIPEEVFYWPYLIIHSTNTASDVDVNQGAARALSIALKG